MNELRPYEPYLNMTTAKWKEIEPERLDIGLLIPTQNHILNSDGESSYCSDIFPHVVLFEGRLYLADGHHRVKKLVDNGERFVLARVKRLSYAPVNFSNYNFQNREENY